MYTSPVTGACWKRVVVVVVTFALTGLTGGKAAASPLSDPGPFLDSHEAAHQQILSVQRPDRTGDLRPSLGAGDLATFVIPAAASGASAGSAMAAPIPTAVWLFGTALVALLIIGRQRRQY